MTKSGQAACLRAFCDVKPSGTYPATEQSVCIRMQAQLAARHLY
jgi:hypothetical protein